MEIKILRPIQGIIIFLKSCGLWPNHNKYYIAYMIYAVIFQFIFTFCYTTFKIINFYYMTEVNLITKSLFLVLGEVAFFFKVFNFHYYHKQIEQLLVDIKEFKIKNQMENDLLQNRLKLFTKISTCYVGCAGIAIFFSLVAPMFSAERGLPYPAWYPIDWHNNRFNFYLLYGYQCVGIFFMAFAIILLETFALYLIMMASAHTDILAMRLVRLGSDSVNESEPQIHPKMFSYLIGCLQQYTFNARFQKTFENAFSIPFFVQFIVSGAILCVTVFQIVMMNPANEIVNFVFYLSYFITISSEIFLPCYFGTELMLKNGQLTTAIYWSNWISCPIDYQKMMVIFMGFTKQNRFLVSGKLFSLSLSNFLLVLNRMYSLYAVLKSFFK